MTANKTTERKHTIGGIPQKVDDKLTVFCKKNGLKKNEFVELSLEYFLQNSINPKTDKAPADELRKILKRIDDIFRFMNVHEKRTLPNMLKKQSVERAKLFEENSIRNKFLNEIFIVPFEEFDEVKNEHISKTVNISLFELFCRTYQNIRYSLDSTHTIQDTLEEMTIKKQ